MKQIRYIEIIVAAILAAGCTKEYSNGETLKGQEVTIEARLVDNQTAKTIIDGTSVLWESSDEVKLFFDGTGSKLVSTNKEPAGVASFSGTFNGVVNFNEGFSDSTPLWGLYPYREDATSDNVSVTTTLPSTQKGRAGSFEKKMNLSLARSNSLSMGFYNVCGGVRFSLTRDDVKNVVFKALNGESVAGKVKLSFEDGVPAVQEAVEGVDSIILSAPAGGTFEAGQWYYIVALPGTLSGGFEITFNTETLYATLESSKSVSVKRGTFGSLADADYGLEYKDKTASDPFEDYYVDLGLSVKWATCNIGANSPEECGTYLAFGTLNGMTWNGSSWSGTRISSNTHPSYEYDSNYNLKPEYDVAFENLGGDWRMPTGAEQQELIDNCTSVWTNDYNGTGVAGRIFTSNKEGFTDKSIFLPASGCFFGSSLITKGSSGYCWSKSYTPFFCGKCIYFGSISVSKVDRDDWSGFPVRPVYGKYIPVTSVSLSETSLSLMEGYAGQLTVTHQPENASLFEISWSSNDEAVATVSADGVVTAVGGGECTVTAAVGSIKAECTIIVTSYVGPEYVDLGLSVKWATCNIGANSPEEYGRYFAWGDVVGQTWNGSEWSEGGFPTYYEFEVDENNNLKPEYDAAHVKYGGNWRMPTASEFQELITNCSYIWTDDYEGTGVAGHIFTSNKDGYTDKSIFLPAAGYSYYYYLYDAGYYGYYWSSTFDSDSWAWLIVFSSDNAYTSCMYRNNGTPIRPILEQ